MSKFEKPKLDKSTERLYFKESYGGDFISRGGFYFNLHRKSSTCNHKKPPKTLFLEQSKASLKWNWNGAS